MSYWTPAREELLARLADGTRTSSELAGVFPGVSRSAIVAKLTRGKGRFGHLRPKGAARRAAVSPAPAVVPDNRGSARVAGLKPFLRVRPTAARGAPVPAIDRAGLAHVPMPFLRAADEARCLFFWCDALAPSGPDMPVCGRPREAGSGRYCRACADHVSRAARAERVAA